MKDLDHPEQAIRSPNEVMAELILLCTIMDVEVGTEFDDLTIRCKAVGGGGETIADLMFNGIDVQILRVALAGVSPASTWIAAPRESGSTASLRRSACLP